MKAIKHLFLLCFTLIACNNVMVAPMEEEIPEPPETLETLEAWLSKDLDQRGSLESLPFANEPISAARATEVTQLLFEDLQQQVLDQYGNQWDNRALQLDGKKMPFFYQVFGEAPEDGRSLFISMHGGGGAPASVNDQQYNNQKHLYDATMANLEGVYLAPRAPGNTWDLWHQSHIDDFFNLLIQLAVLKENVNPNKIYLMGYSAGGDGVFQLAPRMADRFAAAAMSAGHPNETSPLGLKNLPFALHMGANDGAYDRNQKAAEWKVLLGDLATQNPGYYIHDVQIHQGMGHWMQLKDAVAIPWMKNYTRNTLPQSILWKQDDRHHSNFYWLGVPEALAETGGEISISYDKAANEINIEANYSDTLYIHLNDAMLDLNKNISIRYQGTLIHEQSFDRTILDIYKSLEEKGDPNLAFSSSVKVVGNQRIED